MTDWRDMAEFDGVDLEDSFILGWRYSPAVGGLLFDVEAHLGPDHPDHQQPKQDEFACYKRAALLFAAADVTGDLPEPSSVRATRDPDGSEDYGSFDSVTMEDGAYRVVTDFADVVLICDGVSIRVLS